MSESFGSPTESRNTPLNILLVEDNEADVKIALRAFQNAKIKNTVFVAHDGQDCLDFVRHEGAYQDKDKFPRPDMILLDINMPKVDGFGVLKVLKNDSQYAPIPIIIFSASKTQIDVVESYANGANSFIQKPVAYEDFVRLVDCFNAYWHDWNKLPARRT